MGFQVDEDMRAAKEFALSNYVSRENSTDADYDKEVRAFLAGVKWANESGQARVLRENLAVVIEELNWIIGCGYNHVALRAKLIKERLQAKND